MSDATTGSAHAKAARQHHPEGLAAERRRDLHLRAQQLVRQVVVRQHAEDVDAFVGDALARQHEAHRERIGADEAQARAGAPADLRPGAQQHVHALARLVPPDEDDVVLAPCGSASGGMRTPFGTISYSPGSQRCAGARACSETAIRRSIRSARKPQTA